MKTCCTCKVAKPRSEFAKGKNKDGLRSDCRECARKYARHYYRNVCSDAVKERERLRRDEKKAALHILKNVPCADCGIRYPTYVMDFDHVSGEKEFCIGRTSDRTLLELLREAQKCEVVCSNCHRERTHQRRIAASTPPAAECVGRERERPHGAGASLGQRIP